MDEITSRQLSLIDEAIDSYWEILQHPERYPDLSPAWVRQRLDESQDERDTLIHSTV